VTEALKIKTVDVARQFHAAQYTGDDGYPAAVVCDEIHVQVEDGRWFVLPAIGSYSAEDLRKRAPDDDGGYLPFKIIYHQGHEATMLAEKVRRRGRIRPEFWVEFEPDTRTLEQRWADDAYAEAEQRYRHTGQLS